VVAGDVFVSTLPTEVYSRILAEDCTPGMKAIRYTALVSAMCAMRGTVNRDFYWLNLTSLDHSACAIFVLSSLNPTIGAPGETCVNFVTHLRSACDPFFARSNDDVTAAYARDFEKVLGTRPTFSWTRVARIPLYSPIFDRDYQNPPLRSPTFSNMYFAGNYRTFPSVASTGTALHSGLETGSDILRGCGQRSDILERVAAFRLPRRLRG
jgi:hypothetical protein